MYLNRLYLVMKPCKNHVPDFNEKWWCDLHKQITFLNGSFTWKMGIDSRSAENRSFRGFFLRPQSFYVHIKTQQAPPSNFRCIDHTSCEHQIYRSISLKKEKRRKSQFLQRAGRGGSRRTCRQQPHGGEALIFIMEM